MYNQKFYVCILIYFFLFNSGLSWCIENEWWRIYSNYEEMDLIFKYFDIVYLI